MKQRVLRLERLEDRCVPADVVTHWNDVLLRSLPFNTTPGVMMARNMALVHVAMFEAVNSIDRSYEPYFADVPAAGTASIQAAAAQAAFETLVALYPTAPINYQAELNQDLMGIPPDLAQQGIAVGHAAAQQTLALRQNDGSNHPLTYTPPNQDPGQWVPTAPNFPPVATNAHVP